MSSVTNRITIRRAIEDVFAVLTDVEKTGIWFPGDVDEHWTSPPRTVVTEYDPPYRAAMAGTSPNAPFVGTLVFSREGEASTVEVTTEISLRGASRIAGPIFAAWYGRAWARGLETLKRLMESGEL